MVSISVFFHQQVLTYSQIISIDRVELCILTKFAKLFQVVYQATKLHMDLLKYFF